MKTEIEAPVQEPRAVSGDAAVLVEDVTRSYGPVAALDGMSLRVAHAFSELSVLAGIDLRAAPHDVLGVVGPSGCGKSTLLELIAGLLEPTAGTLAVCGDETATGRLARCAYMPQRDLLLPWLSAIDNASLAIRNRGASAAERLGHPAVEVRTGHACKIDCGGPIPGGLAGSGLR